jgi:cytochrome b561
MGNAGSIDASWGILERYFRVIYAQNGYDPRVKQIVAVIGAGTLVLIGLHVCAVLVHALTTRSHLASW